MFSQQLELNRNPLEILRQPDGIFIRAVGEDHPPNTILDEVPGGKLRHLAGADEERPFLSKGPEDLLGQLDCGIADGDGVVRNGGLGPRPFGHPEGMVEQLVQYDPGCLVLDTQAVGLFDLPQDLRLPHDH